MGEVAVWYALLILFGTSAGMVASGRLVDRFAPRGKAAYAYVPAIGLALAVPLFVAFVWAPGWPLALAFLLLPMGLNYFYLSPAVTLVQEEVRPDQRVMSGALLLLVMNLVGLGLGPTYLGFASDFFQAPRIRELAATGVLHPDAVLFPRHRPVPLAGQGHQATEAGGGGMRRSILCMMAGLAALLTAAPASAHDGPVVQAPAGRRAGGGAGRRLRLPGHSLRRSRPSGRMRWRAAGDGGGLGRRARRDAVRPGLSSAAVAAGQHLCARRDAAHERGLPVAEHLDAGRRARMRRCSCGSTAAP